MKQRSFVERNLMKAQQASELVISVATTFILIYWTFSVLGMSPLIPLGNEFGEVACNYALYTMPWTKSCKQIQ